MTSHVGPKLFSAELFSDQVQRETKELLSRSPYHDSTNTCIGLCDPIKRVSTHVQDNILQQLSSLPHAWRAHHSSSKHLHKTECKYSHSPSTVLIQKACKWQTICEVRFNSRRQAKYLQSYYPGKNLLSEEESKCTWDFLTISLFIKLKYHNNCPWYRDNQAQYASFALHRETTM